MANGKEKIKVKGILRGGISPSNRAICFQCHKRIEKGAKRIIHKYQARFMVKEKYCAECGLELIASLVGQLIDLKVWLIKEKE